MQIVTKQELTTSLLEKTLVTVYNIHTAVDNTLSRCGDPNSDKLLRIYTGQTCSYPCQIHPVVQRAAVDIMLLESNRVSPEAKDLIR